MAPAKLDDYITAHEAAQILSAKHHRPVRTDYISKMTRMKKYQPIRCKKIHDIYLYHRGDIENCQIGQRSRLKRIALQVMKHVAIL